MSIWQPHLDSVQPLESWCVNFSVCNLPAAFNGTNFHYICSVVQRALLVAKEGQLHTDSERG